MVRRQPRWGYTRSRALFCENLGIHRGPKQHHQAESSAENGNRSCWPADRRGWKTPFPSKGAHGERSPHVPLLHDPRDHLEGPRCGLLRALSLIDLKTRRIGRRIVQLSPKWKPDAFRSPGTGPDSEDGFLPCPEPLFSFTIAIPACSRKRFRENARVFPGCAP